VILAQFLTIIIRLLCPAGTVNEWHCVVVYSGGTEVTVTGNNMDAAAEPIITITVVVTRLNSTHDDDDDNVLAQITSQSQSTVTRQVLRCDAVCGYI